MSALRLTADWLTSVPVQAVFTALAAGGFTGRAVGGIVRNTLLGRPVTDIDVATDARPDDVMRLAGAAGLHVVPTGLAHGTVTVIVDHVPIEVTTLRRDVATDGRHAEVAFTDDWTADAARRDFTINALYCDRDGLVFDPLGGLADLAPTRVRFIGEAADRIAEDYLRILRFFRFTATFAADGALDPTGLAACRAGRAGLARISGERIRSELLKLLAAPQASAVTATMVETGVLAAALPIAAQTAPLARLIEIETAQGLPDPVRRLAVLLVTARTDVSAIDRRLKLSTRERARLALAADPFASGEAASHWSTLAATDARARLYRLGPERYVDRLLIAWARSALAVEHAAMADLARLPERWTAPRLPVDGTDVMACGVPAGPAVGAALARMESRWIASDFTLDRAALLAARDL